MASLPVVQRNASNASSGEDGKLFNPGLGETAIVLLSLILSAPTKHIYNFLESSYDIEGKDHFATLLTQFFKVAISILENDAWPTTWLNVNILAHKVLIKMMDPVSTLLKRIFIPQPPVAKQFNVDLWRDAYYMLLNLLSSDQLVIEDFTAQVWKGKNQVFSFVTFFLQKRRAVWRLGGDIRGEGAEILNRLWEALIGSDPSEADALQRVRSIFFPSRSANFGWNRGIDMCSALLSGTL